VRARPDRLKSLWDDYSPAKHPDFPKWLATFLGKVARLLADEEDGAGALFGKDKAASILCDILIAALQPLGGGALATRLSGLRSPEACFDAYCVAEEFARRMVGYLRAVDEAHQSAFLSALYCGFGDYLGAYVDAEMGALKASLVEELDRISFSTSTTIAAASSSSSSQQFGKQRGGMVAPQAQAQAGNSLDDELFGSEGDNVDAYGLYSERLLAVADSFHLTIERSLRRAIRFLGGVQIKQVVRSISAILTLFMKHMAIKIDDLSVACGFPRDNTLVLTSGGLYGDASSSIDGSSRTASNARINTLGAEKLLQQHAVADKLSQQLEITDVDSRVLISSSLRTLQAIGRITHRLSTLDVFAKKSLTELQHSLFVDQTSQLSFLNSATSSSSSSSSSSGGGSGSSSALSLGVIYSLQLLQSDSNSLAEVKSFLAAAASAVAINASSASASAAPFAAVASACKKLVSGGCSLLFRLCLEAPEKMIGNLSQEDAWTTPTSESTAAGATGSISEIRELLRENMLPQAMITQVGSNATDFVQSISLIFNI
jgi:hypothetical protein